MSSKGDPELNRLALIGDHLPRQCGIATFTSDLAEALAAVRPETDVFVVPVNDQEEGYAYPARVRFEFAEKEVASYRRAAEFLNINRVDAVIVQHEFGIYGGVAGSHILPLLKELRMPIVTTLHTVLKEPNATQKKVLEDLIQISDRLVVMAHRGVEYLTEIYGAPEEKIDLIHHGIPDVPFVDPNYHKDQFGVEGKTVLLTFGLLSPNKGIEYVIKALPRIVEKHPEVVYIVLGATHPNLIKTEGESYRLKLQRLAKSQGVEAHVIFHNRFVSLEELVQYISATDLYLLPYLNLAQLVSGTLAYSVGMGKAVISTPIWYAEEILSEGRGLIVAEKNADAMAEKVLELLENEVGRHAMRKRAYQLGREMIWSRVADEYVRSVDRAREERRKRPHPAFVAKTLAQLPKELPPLNLNHLYRLTDGTALLRHARFTTPNYDHGYSVDDNARALILMVLLESIEKVPYRLVDIPSRYLAFLDHAFDKKKLWFRNLMNYDRSWKEAKGNEDCQGRAIWALGTVAGRSGKKGLCRLASELFEQALPKASEVKSARARAYVLIGIHEFLRRFYGHRFADETRLALAEELLEAFNGNSGEDWVWFENQVTYDNARLPQALLLCGRWLERGDMMEASLASLDWLCRAQTRESEHFVPIGSNGYFERGKEPARFDQRPLEVHSTVSACLEAHIVTGDDRWLKEAQRAFEWFLGGNDLGVLLSDPETGGCYDSLLPDSVNLNQGAEATLSYLMSLVEMSQAESAIREPQQSDVEETIDQKYQGGL